MWPFAKTAGAATGPSPVAAPVPLCEQGPKIVGAGAALRGASAPADRRINDTGLLYLTIVYRNDGSKRTYDGTLDQAIDMARVHLANGCTRVELEPEWRTVKVSS